MSDSDYELTDDQSTEELADYLFGVMTRGESQTLVLETDDGFEERIELEVTGMTHEGKFRYTFRVFSRETGMSECCATIVAALLAEGHRKEIEQLTGGS